MKLTNEKAKLALTAAVLLTFTGCKGVHLHDKDTDFGRISVVTEAVDESLESETDTYSLLPAGFTKEAETLSEYAEQNMDDRDGYFVKDIPSMRISISLPDGSQYKMTDKYNSVILCDNVIYYLHKFYNSNFESASDVSSSAKAVMKTTNFLYYESNGCSPTVYTPGKVDIVTTSNGFEIAQESPYMVLFQENTMHAYEPSIDTSYMLFQGEAYMLTAVYDTSRTETSSEIVRSVEADILSSVQYYIPSLENDSLDISQVISAGNGITASIPKNWVNAWTDSDSNGGIYTAPEDSLYSGTSIYVYMDKAHSYCTDFLNLPTGITDSYLKSVYKIDKEKLESAETVLNFRQDTNGSHKFNVFDIKETLTPLTMDGAYAFPSEGNELYSLRCSFEDLNGDPGVIIVNYTKDNENLIYGLFTNIESTIKFSTK